VNGKQLMVGILVSLSVSHVGWSKGKSTSQTPAILAGLSGKIQTLDDARAKRIRGQAMNCGPGRFTIPTSRGTNRECGKHDNSPAYQAPGMAKYVPGLGNRATIKEDARLLVNSARNGSTFHPGDIVVRSVMRVKIVANVLTGGLRR
jgi:hypothetical protein